MDRPVAEPMVDLSNAKATSARTAIACSLLVMSGPRMPDTLRARDLDRLCKLAAAGDEGLAIPHAKIGRWLFALRRKLARWGPTPPRNVAGQLLYPRRIYITDFGQTLAKMCPSAEAVDE